MVMHLAFSGKRIRQAEGQATYEMSNLAPEETGLSFVVFVSQKDGARHAARVKVSEGAKTTPDRMGSYSIDPFEYKAGLRLDAKSERSLEAWVKLNRDVLQKFWDAEIMYTSQLMKQLQALT